MATITQDELDSIVTAAKQLWITALGAGDPRLAVLGQVVVLAGNLPSGMLGETTGAQIVIDRSAQGWGWFVDPTPGDNTEFSVPLSPVAMLAGPNSPAAGKMDLLSTVLHELGNAMGFAETTANDVTGITLSAGLRRLPGPELAGTALTGTPQYADQAPVAGLTPSLTDAALAPIVAMAKQFWTATLGAGDPRLTALAETTVTVGQLPAGLLGLTVGTTITIDASGAGTGCFDALKDAAEQIVHVAGF